MRKTAIIIAVLAISVPLLFGVAFGSSEADFQKAVNYYKTGDYAQAARVLKEYVKDRPEGRAYYLLGYANYALGNQKEAARNFQDAYLVDPEMDPQEFRKTLGIDTGVISAKPKAAKPAATTAAPAVEAPAPTAKEAPAPAKEAPAKEAPAAAKEAPAPAAPDAATKPEVKEAAPTAPAEEAPAPRARPRPSTKQAKPGTSMLPGIPMEALGLIPLAVGAIVYLLYSLCLFIIGRKTDTGASWLAFVPGVNFVWPLVGAAGKSKIWILLTLFIPLIPLYLWMCVASRFGRSKILGLLFAFIVAIPLLNILFVKLLFKEAGGVRSSSMGLSELPDLPEEFADLPEVPGMGGGEEDTSFGATPASKSAEDEDFFSEGFGEEEPMEGSSATEEAEGEDIFALGEEEPEELGDEDTEELGAFDSGEEGGERAPTLEEMGFAGESSDDDTFNFAEAEEATPEEAFEEEETPEDFLEGAPGGAPEPTEELEALTPEEAFERAAPHEGAEPWELPEEEGLEYESAEEGEEDFLRPAPAGAGLMGIGDLFTNTWGSYTRRLLPLLGLYLLSFLVMAAVAGIFVGIGALLGIFLEGMREGIFVGSVAVAVVAGFIAFGWGYGAFIFATADDRLGFGAALRKSWQKVGSFLWLLFLVNFIIVGGFMLFFVPGVIFATWFSFAMFVFAREGIAGMDALLKSKEYVRGSFWGIFLRLFLVGIISIGLSWVPFVGSILALLYAPFMMLYIYKMYADLRRLKGEFVFSSSGGQKALYIVLAVLGVIVIPAIIIVVAGASILAPILMQTNMPF